MGMFDYIEQFSPVSKSVPEGAPSDPSKDPNLIRVFDGYGRELFVHKQVWREKVLPEKIKMAWDNPDQLHGILAVALEQGFREDIFLAAQHLFETDPNRERASCFWAVILREENRMDVAEKVLLEYLENHGASSPVFTNLAMLYFRMYEHAKAGEWLWRALEDDPNGEAMAWYENMFLRRGTKEAKLAELRRIAAYPTSWRAQLWLALSSLQSRNLGEALAYYHESLSRAGAPVPVFLLMRMSCDLGKHGHLPEMLELTLPRFDLKTHGLAVGNNLIKAHLDLGQTDAAKELLDKLYALNRPDWRKALDFWEHEIVKTRIATTNGIQNAPPKLATVNISGPVWLNPSAPTAELFLAKPQGAVTVCFLASSASSNATKAGVEHHLTDAPGRMSRAFPLFLTEQVEFRTKARALTLIPWGITPEASGFALNGIRWKDADSAIYAGRNRADYVISSHITAEGEPWRIEVRLVRVIDGKCLGSLATEFNPKGHENSLTDFAEQLFTLLRDEAEVESQTPPAVYQVPSGRYLTHYLASLDQLLAVRCATMSGTGSEFLHGERGILQANLQQCLVHPENVLTRLLLAQTASTMKKVRPGVVLEFKESLVLLQKEKPLAEPVHGLVQRLLNEVFA